MLLLVVVTALLIVCLFFKRASRQKQIPGDLGIQDDSVPYDHYFSDMYRKHGPLFFVKFLGEEYLVMAGPEAMDFFKKNERQYFQVKDSSPKSWEGLYGAKNPILAVDEGVHRVFRRGVTTSMMSLKATEIFYPNMIQIIDNFTTAWKSGQYVHSSELTRLTFAISWVWVLGDRGDNVHEMFEVFEVLVKAFPCPPGSEPYQNGLCARATIISHFYDIFSDPPTDQIPNLFHSFDEYILKDSPQGSDDYKERFADLLIGVTFAAFHATQMALHGAIWEIASNPEVQQTLRDEVMQSPLATAEQLNALPQLETFIKETLRVYNAGVGVYRITNTPFKFGEYDIKANQKIFLFCGYDHYNVPDCGTFIPFGRESTSYNWIPFGIGARTCLGQKFAITELKAIVANLLKSYRLNIDTDLVSPKLFPEFDLNGYIPIEPLAT